MAANSQQIPQIGFLRLEQIIGRPAVTEDEAEINRQEAEVARKAGKKPNWKPKRSRPALTPIIPVKKSTWWAGVKSGRYPSPIKLGSRTTVWRASDIYALLERLDTGEHYE